MSIRSSLLVFMLSLAVSAQNILQNPSFANGLKGWGFSQTDALTAQGVTYNIENGKLTVNIPPKASLHSTELLLLQKLRIKYGTPCRLLYTLDCTEPGIMRHIYQLSRPPYSSIGLVENRPVKAGRNRITALFIAGGPEGEDAHLTFNLSNLHGTITLHDISLMEARDVPVSKLASKWSVILNSDVPASYSSLPKAKDIKQAALQNNTINLAALAGGRVPEKTQAILYNVFKSDITGVMHIGFSADWWMEIFMNGEQIYENLARGNPSNAFTPDDIVLDIPVEKGRNVLAVRVLAGSAGWRFVCGQPRPPIRYVTNDEWKPFNLYGQSEIIAGSALDLSHQVESPAGKFGRAVIGKTGDLVFEQRPNEPLHLMGFNGYPYNLLTLESDDEFKKQAHDFAQAARRAGFRLFRTHGFFDRTLCHGSHKDMEINPAQLDRWDFLLNELKQAGIYLHVTLLSFGLYDDATPHNTLFEERDKHKLQMYLGNRWIRDHFIYGAKTVLNHVNPYTKLAWKDDPAIAFVEFYNEQELGLERVAPVLAKFPNLKAELRRQFREWLAVKYKDVIPPELQKELNGKPLAEAELPSQKDRKSALANAYALFTITLAEKSYAWCEKIVRDTGYKGLLSNYNVARKIADAAARWSTCQYICQNTYFQHPIGGWGAPSCRVGQDSSLAGAVNYWRTANTSRIAGRPFTITEYNHCFWNPYQYENGAVMGAYSALQGFNALQIHENPILMNSSTMPQAIGSFSCGNNPIVRANEFITTHLFQRGDVKPSQRRIELAIPDTALNSNNLAIGGVAGQQSLLALVTGFSIAFPDRKPANGTVVAPKADCQILPEGTSTIQAADWFINLIDNPNGSFSLDNLLQKLKVQGILPAANLSDAENLIFQSDTEEITLWAKEHLLKVITPKSEVVCMDANKEEKLAYMTVNASSTPACVAAIAIDNQPLATSKRIVLVYSTMVANSNLTLSPDRSTNIQSGHPPTLLRCGQLQLQFDRPAKGFKLYALGFNGARREELPLVKRNGKTSISIDTATLKDGPTVFFELVAE
ncbi:MAG: hypothetical protein K6G44_03775 [Lentisphaeria bacterium]|nr:hypothetical protein [Lentisphaeria bacterium]